MSVVFKDQASKDSLHQLKASFGQQAKEEQIAQSRKWDDFPVEEKTYYANSKNGRTTQIYVDTVKGDRVTVKRDEQSKDSTTMTRAEFAKKRFQKV